MKKFFFNLMAAVMVGAACYGIFLWPFGWAQKDALTLGLSVGLSGLTVEYLKLWLLKRKQRTVTE